MEDKQSQSITQHWTLLQKVSLAASVLLLILFYFDEKSYFWIEAWFMLEIFILTFATRTVSLRFALGLYSQGVVFSAGITIILWKILDKLTTIQGKVSGEVVMPIIEESLKFAPVAIAAYLLYKNRRHFINISDFLFLAVFTGAGFSMLEKSYWDGVFFPFTYGPHIGSTYFFPDALGIYVAGEPFGFIGHSAATGLIGMAVGLGLYLRSRQSSRSWWWAVPALAAAWVTLEHILSNVYYVNGSDALLSLGGGMLTPWLFIILLILTLVIDFRNSKAYCKSNPELHQRCKNTYSAIISEIRAQKLPSLTQIVTLIRLMRVTNVLGWEKVLLHEQGSQNSHNTK